MGPNTLRHPSPHPLHPWPIHRHPSLSPYTHGPPILIHTHALNPFTHGPKHCQTPIPDPLYPCPDTDTHPYPLHPWPLTLVDTHPSTLSPMAPILTDTHPLNPFNPGPKHSQTWNPQLCAGLWVGAGARVESGWSGWQGLSCGPRLRVWTKGKHGGQGVGAGTWGRKQGARV